MNFLKRLSITTLIIITVLLVLISSFVLGQMIDNMTHDCPISAFMGNNCVDISNPFGSINHLVYILKQSTTAIPIPLTSIVFLSIITCIFFIRHDFNTNKKTILFFLYVLQKQPFFSQLSTQLRLRFCLFFIRATNIFADRYRALLYLYVVH